MNMSKIAGIAAAVLAVGAVYCANQEGYKYESAAQALACFAIAALCLFFIYRDIDSMLEDITAHPENYTDEWYDYE